MANTNNPMEHAAAIMNPIYNASGGAITSAAYIYDEALGKTQAQINEDIQISGSIESITEYYAAYEFSVYGDGSDNDGIKRDPDISWIQIPNPEGKVIPDLTANKPYLWNYEKFKMSGGKIIETSAKVIGIFSNGRGILEIERYYLVNDDGINSPLSSDPDWALQSPPTTEKNRFLWEKQCIWYTDDPNKEKEPENVIRLIGVMGNPGIDGSDTEYIYIRSKEFKNPDNPTPEDWNSETSKYQTTTDYIPELINEGGLEWTDNPIGTSDVYPYEWVAVRKIKRGEKLWGKFSDPALWSKYGVTGNGILGIKKFYQISNVSSLHPDIPTSDIPSGWEDIKNLDNLGAWTSISPATNKDAMYLWELEITYFTLLEYSYSCKLVGRMGDPGIDGTMIEYIYKTSTSETDIPNNPTPGDWETNTEYQKSDWTDDTNGWFDEPSGINETDICEWTCIREYDQTNSRWGQFVGPKLWARYGKTGTSIISIETRYLKSDSDVLTETIENATEGETETGDLAHTWYKSSPTLTYDYKYLWKKSITKYSAEIDDPDTLQDETKTDTVIKYEMIGTLGEKGVDGNLVDYIYALTPAFDRPNVPEIPSNRIPLSGSFEVSDPSQGTNEDGTYPIVTWTDDPQDMSEEYSYLWICYAEYDQESETWGNYKKVTLWGKYGKDGQPGIDGVSPNAAYKSTCFTRSNKTPDRPSATGSYSSPWPEDTRDDGTLIWSDEIPDGQEKLWAITRVFSTDGKDPQQPEWSNPKQLTDNSTTEYMYSAWAEKGELKLDFDGILFSKDPETDEINDPWYTVAKSKGWYDDPEQCLLEDGTNAGNSRVIWMATSICNNGTWSDWDIVKIKGEKGDSGTSIKIKGSYLSLELFEADWKNEYGSWKSPEEKGYTDDAAFIVILEDGLGYLYVWDGDSWNNVGQFKGDPGKSSYLHVKYANPGISGQANSFTAIVGGETVYLIPTDSNKSETPGRFIGTCVDNSEDDPAVNSSVYTWVKWQGEDGYGYEYIYTLTDSYEAPELPDTNDQADGYIPDEWYDDPLDTDETNPYCWQCYRQKVDGTWSDWKGSKNNPGYAVLWSKYGLDGNGLINKTIHYLISDSNTSSSIESITAENNETNPSTFSPNTWYLVSPSVDKTYKFLWKRTVEEYLRKFEEIGSDTITKYELIGTRGDDGVDGSDIEWAYKLTKTNVAPNSSDSDWPTEEEVTSNSELGKWTDDAQDVSNEWPYQWYIKRTKEPGSNSWGPWGKLNGSVYQASVYRVFGKGIKTVYTYYKTSETSTSPEIPDKTGLSIASYLSLLENTSLYNWSSDGSGLTIDSTNRYLWELTIYHYTDDTYDIQGPVEKASLTNGSIKSIVFCRKNGIPAIPEGGSYENPIPEDDGNNWEDGIPSGTYPIWSSARTFYTDGSHDGERKTYWSEPQQMTSTSDMEIQWSAVETNPGNPSDNPDNWTDTVDYSDSETIVWMATRIIKDGEPGNWVVTKIKGETGNPGDPGTAIYVDLDNDNDTMLYDTLGKTLLSGNIISRATLYSNGAALSDGVTWKLGSVTTGINADIVEDTVTVSGMTVSHGTVQVIGSYNGNSYTATLSLKRLLGGDKYELSITPGSATYYTSTGVWDNGSSSRYIEVSVYRTDQDGNRQVIDNLNGLSLVHYPNEDYNYPEAINNYSSGVANVMLISGWNSTSVILTSSEGIELDKEIIPIFKVKDGENGGDGNDGVDAIYLYIDKPSVTVSVDAGTLNTIMTNTFSFELSLKKGNSKLTPSIIEVTNVDGGPLLGEMSNSASVTTTTTRQPPAGIEHASLTQIITSGDLGKISIKIPQGLAQSDRVNSITVKLSNGTYSASGVIQFNYIQRGMAGEAGEIGPLLYPAGTWDSNTTYTRTSDATPFVYYETNGKYYVLQASSSKDQAPASYTNIWKAYTNIKYIFTEALMAKWARLGSSVFWGDYMFSVNGVTSTGSTSDYSKYVDSDNGLSMFLDGRLSGSFIPNLFLDLQGGMIKTNKLSETFRNFRSSWTYNGTSNPAVADSLSLTTSYNIKAGRGLKLLCMPLLSDITSNTGETLVASEYEIDGVHSTITVLPNINYESSVTSYINGWTNDSAYSWPGICDNCLLVCSDPRYINKYSYRYNLPGHLNETCFAPNGVFVGDEFDFNVSSGSADMFFSINGTLTKWLLIEPGTTAKLRLVNGDGVNIWIVENSWDFEQLPMEINIVFSGNYAEEFDDYIPYGTQIKVGGILGSGSFSSMDTDYAFGETVIGRFYGSKRLRSIYDKDSSTGTSYSISIGIGSNSSSETYIDEVYEVVGIWSAN